MPPQLSRQPTGSGQAQAALSIWKVSVSLLLCTPGAGCSVYDDSLVCTEQCAATDVGGSPAGEGGAGGQPALGGSGGVEASGGVGGAAAGGNDGLGGMAGGQGGSGGTTVPSNPCLTHPIPARGTWTASASSSPGDEGQPSNAVDASFDTRWTTGAPMEPGNWWQLDFGKTVALTGIESYHTHNDHPRGYEIVVSDVPPTLMTPAELVGENDQGTLLVSFDPPLLGRYFHIRQTESNPSWWSITEIFFLCMQ